MPNKVRIPTPLRRLTDQQSTVEVSGATVAELIDGLESAFPGMKARLMEGGELRPFVNIYVNGEDIRYTDGLGTELSDDDEVSIVPAVAGG